MYGPRSRSLTYSVGTTFDARLAEVLQLLGSDFVVRRSQQFAGLACRRCRGQDAADRIVVRHFQLLDVFSGKLTHVTRSDALAGFHQHLVTNRRSKLSVSPRRRSAISSSVAPPFLSRWNTLCSKNMSSICSLL